MKNKKKFDLMMLAVYEKIGKEIPYQTSETLWNSLEEYTDNECVAAFRHVFKYTRHLCHIVPDLMGNLETPREDKAINEANEIIALVSSHKVNSDPVFLDPTTKFLMSRRWKYATWARTIKTSELKWWYKEFVEAYQAITPKKLLELTAQAEQKKITTKAVTVSQKKINVFENQRQVEIELEKRKQQKYRKIDLKQLVKSI